MSETLNTAQDYRKRICASMNYVSQHLAEDISLKDVARAASFSPCHFHGIFKAVVRETVASFTRRLRLERAAHTLCVNTKADITGMAFDCGFSSSQNFAKAFKVDFGCTPTAFRNSKNGNTLSKEVNAFSMHTTYSPDTAFNGNTNERKAIVKAEVKTLEGSNVAYVRKMGAYGPETSEQAFKELGQWAGPRGFFAKGQVISMYWDNPDITPAEKCRTDACVNVPEDTQVEGAVSLQTLKGGAYAVCQFETNGEEFKQSWDDAFAWVLAGGHEFMDQPCFEVYHNNGMEDPSGIWKYDICIPLKQG